MPPVAPDEDGAITWGLGDVLVGLLLGQLIPGIAYLVAASAAGELENPRWPDEMSLLAMLLLQLSLTVVLLGWPMRVALRKGRGIAADFRATIRWVDVPLGIAAGLVTQLIVLPIIYIPLLEVLDDPDVGEVARELADRAHGTSGGVLLVLMLVVMAPIGEELFYRGLVLRSLERRFGDRVALWGSAILFGAIHLQPLQFLGQAAFGLVAALLVQRTGRLGPAILAHAAFNGVIVVVLVAG